MPILAFLSPFISKILDMIPDPAQRAQSMQDIMNALQAWDAQQNEINKVEAANPRLFVSGARPAALWICVFALGYQYILVPFVTYFSALYVFYHPIPPGTIFPPLPVLDDNLWQLMTGLLGLGGLRSFDKLKGLTK